MRERPEPEPERPSSRYEASVSHLAGAEWGSKGWRSFFCYRDLGVTDATGGDYDFRVVRARGGDPEPTGWHYHVLESQIIYCLGGWETIALEDGEVVKLVKGTCLNIPPGYIHNEIGYSPDMEMLVMTKPADVTTVAVDSPSGWDVEAVMAQVAAETAPEALSRPWSWKQPVAGRVR
jgi:quercetin dioxygenase-like cupin family protein